MIEQDEIALARRVPKGSRRALEAMTQTPQYPGRETFNANAAFNLTWIAKKYGGLAGSTIIDRRAAYYITSLGERIRDHIRSGRA